MSECGFFSGVKCPQSCVVEIPKTFWDVTCGSQTTKPPYGGAKIIGFDLYCPDNLVMYNSLIKTLKFW